jgi:hypothetical protein
MPEDLKQLLPFARRIDAGVAGVIILDPMCVMYQSRRGRDTSGHWHPNDRPQHVVNFRADLASDGWQPPLILLTDKPARSVTTTEVARAFQLDGFHFIAGDEFYCWDEPIEEE